jgi:protein ImuB
MVVWCPDWPVAAAAPAGEEADAPLAVVVADRVVACSPAARAAAVRRGQRLHRARRDCPELRALPRDEEREARLFEQVLLLLEGFVPRVEVLRPGLCAFPVRGPARYFGGEGPLARQIMEALAAAGSGVGSGSGSGSGIGSGSGVGSGSGSGVGSGFRCRIGVAEGVFAGELAARTGRLVPAGGTAEFLADYPAAVLERPDLVDLLGRLGIHTLGAFAALPSADVLNRFGADGAVAHRLARGLEPRPLDLRVEGPDLSAGQRFEPPETSAEPLVFAAKAVADRLHAGLAAAGLVCGRVAVEARSADGRQLSRLWRHEGELSAPALAERVRWQLQAWADSGAWDAASAGITELRLLPEQLAPDTGRQLALWGESTAERKVARAAARVQALLGHHAVQRVEQRGGRGPAERVRRYPWGDRPEPAGPPASAASPEEPWPGQLPDPAPAAVPRQPLPAEVRDAAGTPVTVDGRTMLSAPPATVAVPAASRPERITGWTGPWPAVEHWWDPSRGRRLARFQVTTADGRALLLTVEHGQWWLEAAYD